MPVCGTFSHDLLDPRDRGTWDSIKLVRCTIVAINPKYNTADVELGEDPPANVPFGELTDIDCADIPFFTGDSWTTDGLRRKMNSVPIYYHCQGSLGTVGELKTGHMAFNVPLVEITNPPYSAAEVYSNHQRILREKALMLFIPPTKEEFDSGIKGHRYIIGHTDRNDISPCKSEYICLRIHNAFDDEFVIDMAQNLHFGHSSASKTVITIVDPIGKRIYKGLEPYGITFPCIAQDILDKVNSITLDENTPLADIAFLDLLNDITPLYQSAFVYNRPYGNYDTYYFDPYGHEYYPADYPG